jgi:hypothetical protein
MDDLNPEKAKSGSNMDKNNIQPEFFLTNCYRSIREW